MNTDYLTTKQVAAILGKQPDTIRKHALRNNVGVILTPRLRVYTQSDIDRLRELVRFGQPGRRKRK